MATTAMATVVSMQSEQCLHKAAQGLHYRHPQMLLTSIHTYMGLGPEVVATLDI